jgi:hypothetical protein
MKIIFGLCIGLLAMTVRADIPRAYQIIADQYGVPVDVFFSIALQESGKSGRDKFLPWPWTLNIDKKGHYFDTREEAEIALLTAMEAAKQQGSVGRVAVGIGQIYMPSHVNQFVSPIQALDPTENLHYAARLLADHYVYTLKNGAPDWWVAVGRYHTPSNKRLASEYKKLVFKKCLRISMRCHTYGPTAIRLATELASVSR